jgi:hypothetical protein
VIVIIDASPLAADTEDVRQRAEPTGRAKIQAEQMIDQRAATRFQKFHPNAQGRIATRCCASGSGALTCP